MARSFVVDALVKAGHPTEVFGSPAACRTALEALTPSPEHMFWFEYNFLYVLAAGGLAQKSALGDHSAAGYAQRARFYTISGEGRLNFARNVARYLIFLAENTGLASADRCAKSLAKLEAYTSLPEMLAEV